MDATPTPMPDASANSAGFWPVHISKSRFTVVLPHNGKMYGIALSTVDKMCAMLRQTDFIVADGWAFAPEALRSMGISPEEVPDVGSLIESLMPAFAQGSANRDQFLACAVANARAARSPIDYFTLVAAPVGNTSTMTSSGYFDRTGSPVLRRSDSATYSETQSPGASLHDLSVSMLNHGPVPQSPTLVFTPNHPVPVPSAGIIPEHGFVTDGALSDMLNDMTPSETLAGVSGLGASASTVQYQPYDPSVAQMDAVTAQAQWANQIAQTENVLSPTQLFSNSTPRPVDEARPLLVSPGAHLTFQSIMPWVFRSSIDVASLIEFVAEPNIEEAEQSQRARMASLLLLLYVRHMRSCSTEYFRRHPHYRTGRPTSSVPAIWKTHPVRQDYEGGFRLLSWESFLVAIASAHASLTSLNLKLGSRNIKLFVSVVGTIWTAGTMNRTLTGQSLLALGSTPGPHASEIAFLLEAYNLIGLESMI